ncbi:MAG: hypothetical protein MET45_28575 [Nostoc sp. LLA-1]|nr:hypothetical protein [Cyanocohniella sp. LLY]
MQFVQRLVPFTPCSFVAGALVVSQVLFPVEPSPGAAIGRLELGVTGIGSLELG